MPDRQTVQLSARPVSLHNAEFCEVCNWSFSDWYVTRLLNGDIPQRVSLGARMWVYCNPAREIVGFGSIELCSEYVALTDGRPHPYIPLLAVNPSMGRRGYGTEILKHLIGEAVLLAYQPSGSCHDVLFLDVYSSNTPAINLYQKNNFTILTPEIMDPIEGRQYIVMGRSVRIAPEHP